jgi:hypothetical protein
MTLNIVPAAPIGSAYANFVYTNIAAGATTNGASLGFPDPTRRIIAFVGGAYGSISNLTIGGVAATSIVGGVNTLETALGFIAHVPSGTTGTVAITGGGSQYKLVLYALYESSSTPFDTASTTGTSIGIDVPDRGVILGYRSHVAAANTTWVGLDEDTDLLSGVSGGSTGAHREFATAQTGHGVSATGGSSAFPVVLGLSFGP